MKYITDTGNRISGNIRVYEMDESTYLEIDEPGDWEVIEKQLKNRKKKVESYFIILLGNS